MRGVVYEIGPGSGLGALPLWGWIGLLHRHAGGEGKIRCRIFLPKTLISMHGEAFPNLKILKLRLISRIAHFADPSSRPPWISPGHCPLYRGKRKKCDMHTVF